MKYVFDEQFGKYGEIIKGIDFTGVVELMKGIQVDKSIRETESSKELEHRHVFKEVKEKIFKGKQIQVGWCLGHNHKINMVEYHKTCQVFIVATDCVMFFGLKRDMEFNQVYNTKHMEGFFVPKGTAVKINPEVLHCTPCNVNSYSFKVISVNLKHTNEPLEYKTEEREDRTLFAKNRWLIVNREAHVEGAFCGLKGETLAV
ncbi:DUF4867 family protein [Anaerostipes sp.]|uniref:DUF4867 family protein n=1 Tax=Anaerostipes sp. TaxID=1872530 RepID=UPI0025BFDE18|nr:DUF4867 family protein [Anaerostipes sp.]MBS7009028.1 DUF4867 family protein [Anaerostipes sp.]